MPIFSDLRRKWIARSLERDAARSRSPVQGRLDRVPRWALALLGLAVFALLYWGVLGWLMSDTSADLALRPDAAALPPGGSVTAAMAAALTERNTRMGGWTPNDIFLKPTAFLTEMPAFQTGQHRIVAGTVAALAASLPGDEGLDEAREDYAVPPTRAVINGAFPFIGGSAASRYRDGADGLVDYNRRLNADEAELRVDADAAAALLAASLAPLSESARELDAYVRGEPNPAAADPEMLYARVRGEAYAATMLLRALRDDFDRTLRRHELGSPLVEAVEALDRIAAADPLIVSEDELTRQAYFLRTALGALSRMRGSLAGAA